MTTKDRDANAVCSLLAAIDSALSPQVESGEASETNHDEDSSAQPHAKRAHGEGRGRKLIGFA